ncbi:MAG TPA: sensor histidine kinase N-terminal domain-containing protein [Burkholderiaceae bacterium]|nr:sensor histidine kinase N-terminal domain-containing protein [Burkholderiaceae bacterium]
MSRDDEPRSSLRRALLRWLLLPLVVLIPLTAALIYALALRPALDALDRALTDAAVALAQIVEVRDGQVTLPLSEQTAHALRADLMDETVFAVGDPGGRLLGGQAALLALTPAVSAGQWRFFEATLDGKPVRVAAHGRPCGARADQVCTVVVAETLAKQSEARHAALFAALLGAAALALPLVGLALFAVRRALRPLQRAAAEVESLTPQCLAPVDAQGMPREVIGFVHALNRLLERLQKAAAAQRAFISDAAHQLRTPLSVMRVEAAEALAGPHAAELRPSLERLHAAAERGTRLAQQLLALARAEGMALDPTQQRQALDLSRLAAGIAEHWLRPSIDAAQDIGFDLEPAPIEGHPVLLEELLGNLIHNAIEHAGPGARITIRTRTLDGLALLDVEDDGRGVPADELDLLWQRFRRGRDARGAGSGLGLTIVADIARLHGATATLASGDGARGLRVQLRFPAARGAATR